VFQKAHSLDYYSFKVYQMEDTLYTSNSRNETKAVGTTSIKVSEMLQPGVREVIVIGNVSTGGQIVTISIGRPSAANAGIPIYPGSVWSEYQDARFNPSNDEIWLIASAAAGSVSIYERIKVKG